MDKTSPLKEAITGFLAPFLLCKTLLLFLTQHATQWFPIFDRYRIYACPLLYSLLVCGVLPPAFHLLLRHLCTLTTGVANSDRPRVPKYRHPPASRFTQSEDTVIIVVICFYQHDHCQIAFSLPKECTYKPVYRACCSQHQHAYTMGRVQHRGTLSRSKTIAIIRPVGNHPSIPPPH